MNTLIRDFKTGVKTYGGALQLIQEKRLWYFFIFPVMCSLAIGLVMVYFRAELFDWIEGSLNIWIAFEDWPSWLQFISGWLIEISLFLLTWYLFIRFQKYILLIVLSPVLAYVSEKTEECITGKKYDFVLVQFIKDVLRGILIAVRNLSLELLFTVCLFFLGLVPIFAPFTFVLSLLVGWYYFGYSTMDYSNERKLLSISESNASIRERKGVAIANGMVFELLFMIPILGFVIAPILATVAATIAMNER